MPNGDLVEDETPCALAHRGSTAVAAPSTVDGNMLALMAQDPNVNVEKLERLVGLHERMLAKQAEAAYYSDFAKMQAELPVIGERGGIKDKTGKIQSRYALWEDINKAILPVLKKYGFSLSFRQKQVEGGICVTGILGHKKGHSERTELTLPHDQTGSKNAVQAIGSSVSYGKRYTAGMLLNLTSSDDPMDDDGAGTQGEQGPALCTQDQWATLQALAEEVGANFDQFFDYMESICKVKIDNFAQIPANAYNDAVAVLQQKRKNPGPSRRG